MKRLFTTLSLTTIFVLGVFTLQGQNNRSANPSLPYNGEMCGSALIHNQMMKSDPSYRARFLANEQKIEEIITNQKAGRSGQNSVMATVYTIPVVVHVIHLGEAVGVGTNISDAQIQSAINNLNTAYRNQSPYNGVDIEVQFALAQRDPNCNSTTGINRVSGAGVSDYSTNGCTHLSGSSVNEATIKALSKWPNTTYYNIWVVAGIDGNMGGGGIQGYAYFPGAGADVDGAVMLYNAFGYDPTGTLGYNLKSYTNHNGTAIHELGHAFNLYHTFEGDDANGDGVADQCPVASGCGSGAGDCCNDTPPHERSNSDCNSAGTNACDGGSSNSLFVHNFMDYSSDACKYQFTADQKTRMRAAIYSSRGSLINNLATTAPSGTLPLAACIPVVQNSGNYAIGVYGFTFNTLDVPSGNTYSDGGYVDRTCYHQTTVTAGTAVTITVNTGPTYNHNVVAYIDFNNDGDFADAGETVFSSNNVLTTHTGTINIPASPPLTGTLLRMRILADYYTSNITSACFNPAYGQAEDFGITITAAAPSAPVANFSGSPTSVCVGGSVAFTDASTNSPTSWSWTFEGGNPPTSSSQNPTVTYTAAGTYSVSLTATNASGSNTMNKTSYITVNAKPAVTANASANPICSGSSTTLTGGGASTYTWTGGVTNGVATSPSSTTSYTVTGTDGNGCTNTAAITVTVNATPTVNVSGTMTITSGGSTTLTASNATTYSWTPSTGLSATNGATVVANPTATTVYTVTGTTGSCSGTKTFTITVNAATGPTSLMSSYCGITESTLNQSLYCYTVNNATNYQYEVTDLTTNSVYTYTRGNNLNNFELDWLTTTTYARTYSIRVAAYVSGAWTAYGSACTVTAPAAPSTSLMSSYCGITESTLNQVLYCYTVVGAANYRYEITDQSSGSVIATYVRGNNLNNFELDWVTAAGYGKTYSIKVAAYVGGVWLAYGSACTVTTPAAPSTSLMASYCGITASSLSQVVYCYTVTGATNYRYEITDQSSGSVVATYVRGNNLNNFELDWVSAITYSKTYSIKVAAYVGTTWLNYGSACTVTTPAFPTTQLQASSCGITESTFSQSLWCVSVTGATDYRYEITDLTTNTVYTYQRGNYLTNLQLDWMSYTTYARTYSIRVAAYVGNTWGSYGVACSVTTPPAPTTQLQPSSCNITESVTSQTLNCVAVSGADNYRYQLTDQTNGTVLTYTRGNWLTDFQMSLVSGISFSRTYSVKVAASVGGTWYAYGTACNVTTGSSFVINPGDAAEQENGGVAGRLSSLESGISLNVYPNPNDGHVYLNVNKDMKVTVTNLLGEKIYEGDVKEGVNELYFLDSKAGMYIIRVSDGENATQVRMIKN